MTRVEPAPVTGAPDAGMRLLFAIDALALPGEVAERVVVGFTAAPVARGYGITVVSHDPPDPPHSYPFDTGVDRVRLGRISPLSGLTARANVV